MIAGAIRGLDSLRDLLDRLRRKPAEVADLPTLARKIRQIVLDDNREGLLAQIGADGKRLADLAPSTLKGRRGGSGPPGVPQGAESRLIVEYDAEIVFNSDGTLSIFAGWGGRVPAAYFLNKGTNRMPARPLVGLRPATRDKIQQALDEHAAMTGDRILARF